MENVTSFKYLGRVMTAGHDNYLTVAGNLHKARKSWGADVEDFEPGGGRPEGIGELFQGGSTGVVSFWGRYVGPDPPDGAGPVQLSAQGCAKAHRKVAKEAGGWDMGPSSAGGGNGGSGI